MRRTPHYIAQLKKTKIPFRHIVIDTEATIVKRAGGQVHKWAVGASADLYHDSEGGWSALSVTMHSDPDDLWEWCAGPDRDEHDIVIWAHNVGYDLRVSRAMDLLPLLGWELEGVSLARMATWASWRREGQRLLIVDLWAWCPVPLTTIAGSMGLSRPNFEYENATTGELGERCAADVDITARAVCAILGFLEDKDLGSFRPTGSGQCHAAWRRRFMPAKSVLVHCDEHALAAERRAMHAGRTEAWRHGEVSAPLAELDMELAYCHIAAHDPLPGKLTLKEGHISLARYQDLCSKYCVLCDVTVKTEVELVPITEHERTYWPVGRVDTPLWDPEIDLVLRSSAKVRFARDRS